MTAVFNTAPGVFHQVSCFSHGGFIEMMLSTVRTECNYIKGGSNYNKKVTCHASPV